MATISALSPSRFDILNAIDTANNGDTIIIPAGESHGFVDKLISLTFEKAVVRTSYEKG